MVFIVGFVSFAAGVFLGFTFCALAVAAKNN